MEVQSHANHHRHAVGPCGQGPDVPRPLNGIPTAGDDAGFTTGAAASAICAGDGSPAVAVLRRLRWSWLGLRTPACATDLLDRAIAFAMARREHQRHLEFRNQHDPRRRSVYEFTVPRGEHVAIPGLVVAELFSPSEAMRLGTVLARLRCRDPLNLLRGDRHVSSQIRAAADADWWRLKVLIAAGSTSAAPDAQPARLPAEFDEVEVDAVRIGEGLCAVVATFYTTEAAQRRVDEVWHRHHHPELRHGRGRQPRAETAELSALRHTQLARQSLHDAARQWLGRACPGFFAANAEPQPLLDLMLFTRRDASLRHRPSPRHTAAYSALGLTEFYVSQTSPGLRAMNLERVSAARGGYVHAARTWALWGQRQEVMDGAMPRLEAGGDRAIARHAARAVQDHLVRMSISEQLSMYLARYSSMRDHAQSRRGFLRIKHLEAQRENLLSLSLNVSTIERAVREFNEDYENPGERRPDVTSFVTNTAPWLMSAGNGAGQAAPAPADAVEQLASDQSDMLDQLKQADEQYRTILPVSASLASSMQALRASRIARWIASMSLVVSLLVLSLADTATSPRIAALLQWLTSHL